MSIENLASRLDEVITEAIKAKVDDYNFDDAIEKALDNAVDDYNFDEAIEKAIDDFNFERPLKEAAREVDLSDVIDRAVDDYNFDDAIEKAIESYDFNEAIDQALIDFKLAERVADHIDEVLPTKVKAAFIALFDDVDFMTKLTAAIFERPYT